MQEEVSSSNNSPEPTKNIGLVIRMDSSEPTVNPVVGADTTDSMVVTGSASPSGPKWPSLWDSGPRRSAFQPYKPKRDAKPTETRATSAKAQECEPSSSKPLGFRTSVYTVVTDSEALEAPTSSSQTPESRAPSTTAMTNVQRGNMQAEPAPVDSMSWFTLMGRGDITADMLSQMIAEGQDIDCVDEEGFSGLMWAAYYGQIHTVQILLEEGAMVDRQSILGETALMLAATEGHLEIIRLLLEEGADVNLEDCRHCTALMCAAYQDHPHTINELLLHKADPWVCDINDNTAYDIAILQSSHKSRLVLERYFQSLIRSLLQNNSNI